MNGSPFPSDRKGIICTAVGDISALINPHPPPCPGFYPEIHEVDLWLACVADANYRRLLAVVYG